MEVNRPGVVYIASMNLRGTRPDISHIPNCVVINATSAQAKTNQDRLDFSPMTPITGGYNGFWNFESYWQSGKVFKGIPREKTLTYWQVLKEPKRRYPGSKGKEVLYAEWNGQRYGYVDSRKQVYVPKYYELIKDKSAVAKYKRMLAVGKNIVVLDFDGPRSPDNSTQCLPLTLQLCIDKINDVRFPFGHGYIVASTIAEITPDQYV